MDAGRSGCGTQMDHEWAPSLLWHSAFDLRLGLRRRSSAWTSCNSFLDKVNDPDAATLQSRKDGRLQCSGVASLDAAAGEGGHLFRQSLEGDSLSIVPREPQWHRRARVLRP